MGTFLSRIFGKKAIEPAAAPADAELDISALKPLMKGQNATSADPRDLSGAWTMHQVTTVFPTAQRALFQRYHVGGCASCGFLPADTLEAVAKKNGLDLNEVVEHIQWSHEIEQDLEITPRETAELLKQEKIKLLDVRTPEEYGIARVPGSLLVDQPLAQDIRQTWPKDVRIVTICHHGIRSLDAAIYLRGLGFANAKSMMGGIEAWSLQVDSAIPRY